jgi:heptosyltransferase-2
MTGTRKWLVIQTAFIGDVILSLAVVQRLKATYPNDEIHLLVRAGNEDLAAHHPDLTRVWVWHKKRHKYRRLGSLAQELRREGFHGVINLQRYLATGVLTVFSGAAERRGFTQNPLSFAFTYRTAHSISTPTGTQDYLHEVDRNLKLLTGLCPTHRERPRLHPPPHAEERITGWLGDELPFVALAPGSVWATKQWPLPYWQTLCEKLVACNWTVVVVGGTDIQAFGQELANHRSGKVRNAAGCFSLLESAVLIGRASRLYTNDSGPLHMASALNTPTTALFCSTIPEFGFGPLAEGSVICQTPEALSCRPCGLHGHARCPEGHFRCGQTLLPELVPLI